jgi:hypothetical protein
VLPIEEAIAFLQDRTGRSDEAGARTLAGALGRLPLALNHAAAYCKRTQMSFIDYATNVTKLVAVAPRGSTYPRSVAATFNLAIDEAVAQCAAAELLMAYLAYCNPDTIPMTLVDGAISDEEQRREAVGVLAELSLLKHDPLANGPAAVAVHRLVQTVALSRAEVKGTARTAWERLLARLAALYPMLPYLQSSIESKDAKGRLDSLYASLLEAQEECRDRRGGAFDDWILRRARISSADQKAKA